MYDTHNVSSGSKLYGGNVSTKALHLERRYRQMLSATAKRGPRPGIETKVYNSWKAEFPDAIRERK